MSATPADGQAGLHDGASGPPRITMAGFKLWDGRRQHYNDRFDITYRARFTVSDDGTQTATLRRAEGKQAAGIGDEGQIILQRAPVSMGNEVQVTDAGEYRFFAGWRSDPFFFDVNGNPEQPAIHRRNLPHVLEPILS